MTAPGRWLAAFAALAALVALAFHEGLLGWGAIDAAAHLPYADPIYGGPRAFPPNLWWLIDRSAELAAQPWDAWIVRCWRAGELPLWQPYNGFGAPLFANGQAGALNPFKLLLWQQAWGQPAAWFLVLRHLVAGAGVLALARQLGYGPWAGLLAALGFALSGCFLYPFPSGASWPSFMLPWLALAGVRLAAQPGRRTVAWLALALAFTGILGHAEVALATGLAAAIATTLTLPWSPRPRRALVALGLAGVLAALVAAIAVIPFLAVAAQSTSYLFAADATGRENLRVTGTQDSVWIELAHHLLAANADRWLNEFNAGAGVVALALLPAGLAHRGARRLGLAYLGAGWLLVNLCEPTAVIKGLTLPVHAFYGVPALALGVALLGGAGLDLLLCSPRATRWTAAWAATLAGVAVFLLPYGDHRAFGLRWFGAPGDLTLTIAAALGALLALAVSPALRGPYLVAVAAAELVLQARLAVPPVPPAGYASTPLIARLQAAGGRVAGGGTTLLPNTNLAYGIESVEGLEVFVPERAARLQRLVFGPTERLYTLDVMANGFRPAFLDLAGVRWLLLADPTRPQAVVLANRTWVTYQADPRPPEAQGAAEHLATALAGYPKRATQPHVALYENPTVMPRAWVAYQADFQPPDPARAQATLAGAPARWRDHALVEATPPPGWTDAPGPAGPATIADRGPNHVTVAATLPRPGWLVLAETWTPDWRAEVDGRPAEVVPADLAFRAVLLPAGHHVVRFRYAPKAVAAGAAGSLAGLVVCLALLRPRLRRTLAQT